MPPPTRACPKCGCLLSFPQPAPEKVSCPKCRAIIRISAPAKASAAASVPAAPARQVAAHAQATAEYVRTSPLPTTAGLKVQDELASGGFGVVYLAYHLHLKDFRALKRPRAGIGLDRDILLARFRREVEALGGLYNNHIVRAHDAGADDEGPYLVMEYLNGAPLSRLVARRRQLPVPEACELIRQAALGLQAAHERGLVHRDVKPSNLMLARDGAGHARVVVIDWGLVKRTSDSASSSFAAAHGLTGVGSTMGTADYMAPEQISDARGVDIRADVYSLGATLYCLLAGKPPFHDRQELEKLLAHQRDAFPSLERLRSDVPAGVAAVLRRMVEKDPARRFATPGEAAKALEPFCCGAESPSLAALLDEPSPANEAAPAQETKGLFHKPTELTVTPSPIGVPASVPHPQMPGEKTVLAPAPASPKSPSSLRRLFWLGAAMVCLLLLAGSVVGVVWALHGDSSKDGASGAKDDGKDSPKSEGPQVLIDEDFRKAVRERETLPDGWTGDAFRVVVDHEEPCLEVSRAAGEYFVKAPPVALTGNFTIEGVCLLNNAQHLIIRLESRKNNVLLPVVIDGTGKVLIADDPQLPPPNFKPLLPIRFVLKREGKKLRIFLNDDVVADKYLDVATEYETLQFGMTAGPGPYFGGVLAKVFRVKVSTQPTK